MTTEARPDAATAVALTRPRATNGGDPLDPARIKLDFPILDQEIHGHRLVYLDSASTSQKPAVVIDAVDEYYRGYNANIHRGIYELAEKSTAAWEGARGKVATLIGGQDPHEIVFVRNATEAINLVAYSWGRKHISRGDVIVLTEMEHHANLVPWQILAQEKDADLEFIPITDDGILRQDVFDVLLKLKPKLVAFTHVSNTLGTINPVEEMTRKAHEAGALVLIDGAQAVPHVPVDVTAIGCDFYVFSGHKMLAPTGSGVLWGRKSMLEAMPPFMGGGDMIREVHLRRSEWNDVPWKFEAGTPDIAAGVGLGAAADYLVEIGSTSETSLRTRSRSSRGMSRASSCTGRRPTSGAASFRSTCRASTRTTSRRSWTGMASPSAPGITARCRSTSASTSRRRLVPRSRSTRPGRTSTRSRRASRRSSACSPAEPRGRQVASHRRALPALRRSPVAGSPLPRHARPASHPRVPGHVSPAERAEHAAGMARPR